MKHLYCAVCATPPSGSIIVCVFCVFMFTFFVFLCSCVSMLCVLLCVLCVCSIQLHSCHISINWVELIKFVFNSCLKRSHRAGSRRPSQSEFQTVAPAIEKARCRYSAKVRLRVRQLEAACGVEHTDEIQRGFGGISLKNRHKRIRLHIFNLCGETKGRNAALLLVANIFPVMVAPYSILLITAGYDYVTSRLTA